MSELSYWKFSGTYSFLRTVTNVDMFQCLKQHNLLNSIYMTIRLLGPFKNFLFYFALNREDCCCKLRTWLTSCNEYLWLSAISFYSTVTWPQGLTNTVTIQLMTLLVKSAVQFCPLFKLSSRPYIIKLAEQVKKKIPWTFMIVFYPTSLWLLSWRTCVQICN